MQNHVSFCKSAPDSRVFHLAFVVVPPQVLLPFRGTPTNAPPGAQEPLMTDAHEPLQTPPQSPPTLEPRDPTTKSAQAPAISLPFGERRTFAKKNHQTGLIEIIDEETFQVVAVQKSPVSLLARAEEKMHKLVTADGREVWIESGIEDPGKLVGFPYSEILVDLICEKITEGASLTKVCATPGFPPYSVVARWMRKFPGVKDAIEQARRDRAEYLRDEALQIVDDVEEDTDAIAKAKARAEMRKWAAQIDDPQRYAKSDKAVVQGALHIVVDTGIMRPGDPGFREVKEIKDGESKV